MADFSIDPEFQEQLDWIREFVKENVETLDLAFQGEESTYDKSGLFYEEAIRPLQQKVKDRGLWSCHLTPEYGGQGYGQVRLAYMNEILGRSQFAPTVFGTQAPDSGNAEIIAHYGTDEQKDQLPPAAARRPHLLLLLDDRAPGRRRPRRLPLPGRPRRRRVGHRR